VLHPLQRLAVRAQLDALQLSSIPVDTVEKMQGQERNVVVVCLAYQDADKFVGLSSEASIIQPPHVASCLTVCPRIAAELDFVFSLPRMNVSVTRARKKVVLIVSDMVRAKGAFVFIR